MKGLYGIADILFLLKEFNGFIHTHVQHIINTFAIILYFQYFFLKPFSATNITGQVRSDRLAL